MKPGRNYFETIIYLPKKVSFEKSNFKSFFEAFRIGQNPNFNIILGSR